MLSVLISVSLLSLLVHGVPTLHSPSYEQAGSQFRRDTAASDATALQSSTVTPTSKLANGSSSAVTGTTSAESQPTLAPTTGSEVVFLLPPDAPSVQDSESAEVGPLVMAYYPDWAGASFPPEKVDFSLFDWIDFAFGLPTQDFNITWDDPIGAPELLTRLVKVAHSAKKKVKLSIGGWTGSRYFSSAVATNQSRQAFVDSIQCTYEAYNVDGIEIDWEYPGHEGADGNQVDPNDSANFLSFLQLLRKTLPAGAVITAATQTSPFVDNTGQPMTNVSEFAEVLDWILLMNYDVWSASPEPGPNAPMYDACHNSSQPYANAVAAYNSWTSAGFPASQLVLGLPSYGYVSTSNATSLRTRSLSRFFTPRSTNDTSTEGQNVRVVDSDGGSDGQVQFRELLTQGALAVANGTDGRVFVASGGFTRSWDECSSTPYLQSASASQVIPYDDPQSLAMKAAFAKKVGMLGTNMFDVHGDTAQWDLTYAVRQAMGL